MDIKETQRSLHYWHQKLRDPGIPFQVHTFRPLAHDIVACCGELGEGQSIVFFVLPELAVPYFLSLIRHEARLLTPEMLFQFLRTNQREPDGTELFGIKRIPHAPTNQSLFMKVSG